MAGVVLTRICKNPAHGHECSDRSYDPEMIRTRGASDFDELLDEHRALLFDTAAGGDGQ